jgi:hypothetical protein
MRFARRSDWAVNPRVGNLQPAMQPRGGNPSDDVITQSTDTKHPAHAKVTDPQTSLTSLVPFAKVIGQILVNAPTLLRYAHITCLVADPYEGRHTTDLNSDSVTSCR